MCRRYGILREREREREREGESMWVLEQAIVYEWTLAVSKNKKIHLLHNVRYNNVYIFNVWSFWHEVETIAVNNSQHFNFSVDSSVFWVENLNGKGIIRVKRFVSKLFCILNHHVIQCVSALFFIKSLKADPLVIYHVKFLSIKIYTKLNLESKNSIIVLVLTLLCSNLSGPSVVNLGIQWSQITIEHIIFQSFGLRGTE